MGVGGRNISFRSYKSNVDAFAKTKNQQVIKSVNPNRSSGLLKRHPGVSLALTRCLLATHKQTTRLPANIIWSRMEHQVNECIRLPFSSLQAAKREKYDLLRDLCFQFQFSRFGTSQQVRKHWKNVFREIQLLSVLTGFRLFNIRVITRI